MVMSQNPIVSSKLLQNDRKYILIALLFAFCIQSSAATIAYWSWKHTAKGNGNTKAAYIELVLEPVVSTAKEDTEVFEMDEEASFFTEEPLPILDHQALYLPNVTDPVFIQPHDKITHVSDIINAKAEIQSLENVDIIYRPKPLEKPYVAPSKTAQAASPNKGEIRKDVMVESKGKGRCSFSAVVISSKEQKAIKRALHVRGYTNKQARIYKLELLRSSGSKSFDQKFMRKIRNIKCPQAGHYYDFAQQK